MINPFNPFSDRDQFFPKLTPAQIAVLEPHGVRRRYKAGEILVAVGSQHAGFMIVLSGLIEIYRGAGPEATRLSTLGPSEFGGEFSMVAGHRAILEARAGEDSEILAINEQGWRAIAVTHAEISEIFVRALILRRIALIKQGWSGLQIVGSRHSADTLRLREFLTRNSYPYSYLDVEADAETAGLLEKLHIRAEDVPIAIWGGTQILRNPSNRALADYLGISGEMHGDKLYDLVVVGAGPAGIAAAVYASSEGLSVIVLDAHAPGGQAGISTRIENYLGFPTGIAGQELAGRAYAQALKFGTEFAIPREVTRLRCDDPHSVIELDDGATIRGRCVLIASGARYRKPDVANFAHFEGRGIYYRASFVEAQLSHGGEVVVLGGGNSAGQAAVYLSEQLPHVHLLVRGDRLSDTMSRYLIQRIEAAPNITLRAHTVIDALYGEEQLERLRWRNLLTDELEVRDIGHVFAFIGADPNTGWLQDCVTLDAKGFVKTGNDLAPEELVAMKWNRRRPPHPFETSRPGIFCAGDVRHGSVKRVASAVGEGAVVVQYLHSVLQE
jgi:thioredoxin reductase (NADPH)